MIIHKSYATNNINRDSSSMPNCPLAEVALICAALSKANTLAPPFITVNPLGVGLPA
jgi:hypothetical protein